MNTTWEKANQKRQEAEKAVRAARGRKDGTTGAKQHAFERATAEQLRVENAMKERA